MRLIPGEVRFATDDLDLNENLTAVPVTVRNTGDRPIQVGSHYHFSETNPALEFDRELAWGKRLNIPAGTSVRFEPGIAKAVELIPILGARRVPGLRAICAGDLDRGVS
jgi:urease subunit beta